MFLIHRRVWGFDVFMGNGDGWSGYFARNFEDLDDAMKFCWEVGEMSLETLWRSRREMVPQNWTYTQDGDVEVMVSVTGKHCMVRYQDQIHTWEFPGKGTSEEALAAGSAWVVNTIKELRG